MNRIEILEFLKKENIPFEMIEHKAVYTMEEINDVYLPYPECDAKNLFIRDDKKRNYYLISLKGNRNIDLKAFRKMFNTRPLSFASAEDLMKYLKLEPGSVSPLGLLNDEECSVTFYLDSAFKDRIGVHPNDNKATLFININDLIRIIENHGNKVVRFE